MKKFAKMSLVAAVAVAGFTSSVSAKDLSEAIKGVDISGTVVYRYDDRSADDASDRAAGDGQNLKKNNYKAVVNLKSPINDDMALNASVVAGNNASSFASLDYTSQGDSNVALALSKVNFVYTGISHTTAIVGKQGLTTPWTVASDSDSNEQTGTGILALVNAGPATIAAAYFNQTNLDKSGDAKVKLGSKDKNGNDVAQLPFNGSEDIWTAGVMANVGPVALDAWYLTLDGQGSTVTTTDAQTSPATTATSSNDTSFDTYTLGASYGVKVSDVNLNLAARYTNLDFDKDLGVVTQKNSMWQLVAKANMGIFGAKVAYAQTDKKGGLVALDNDAKTGMTGWTTQVNGVANADYIQTNINVQAMKALNVAVNYNTLDADKTDGQTDTAKDKDELYLQLTWKPSKNFYTYVRYGQNTQRNAADTKDVDSTIGRLQVQYSF